MSSPKKNQLLGNHQRCWIWGRHLVETTLETGIWPILELWFSDRLSEPRRRSLTDLAGRRTVRAKCVPPELLDRTCRTREHQGMAAKMPPFPYRDPAAIQGRRHDGMGPLLLLDGVQDAYNFGAIIRTADIFGARGICIAEHGQVGVTSMVARASAGAVNHVPIYRLAAITEFPAVLRRQSFQIVGASEKGDVEPEGIDWSRPTVLIMGNEGRGIQPDLLESCDRLTRIRQRPGAVPSLNVAVAAAILLYEAARGMR